MNRRCAQPHFESHHTGHVIGSPLLCCSARFTLLLVMQRLHCSRAFNISVMAPVGQARDVWVYMQVDVDIMVKERPMKSADIEAEWQIAPGPSGRAAVASIVPGGTLTFEHRNIARKGRQVAPCHALALSAFSTTGLGMLKG